MTDLGTLGGASSGAAAINAAGQVVGWSTNASGVNHAFLWENGTMMDLGTLGGNSSAASGINDAGLIVGTSQTSNSSHGFLWVNGLMRDLGTLGGSSSAAYGINDADQVVGESQASTGLYHAFLWPPPLAPYHNVGVTGDGDPLDVIVGTPVTIHVTAHNEGNRNETFNVTTYAGSMLIGTRTVTDLPAFESESWSYTWNTTNITPNRSGYALRFEASLVANETYPDDNYYTGPTVMVRYAAQVTATPSATDVGFPISFTCSSADLPPTNLLYFSWDFGDGVIESGANLTHVYHSPGTFTASCLVTNQGGITAEGQTVVEIHPTLRVTAIVDWPQADPGAELTFTATTTGGSGGLTFNWAFGDGLSDQGATVGHAYASVGAYTVTVTARDAVGGITSNSIRVLVSHVFVIASKSRATTSPGKPIMLSARAAGGSGGFEYHWSFGDGSFAVGATVTHAYAFSGQYVVTVRVTDSLGGSASTFVLVIVSWYSGATSSMTISGTTQETVMFPSRDSRTPR
jgi:probable HAF family extracellular repeat protein